MISGHCLVNQLHAGLHLAGGLAVKLCGRTAIILKAQRRITADLAQPGQLCQYLKLPLLKLLVALFFQAFHKPDCVDLIELSLFFSHPGVHYLLHFVRKLF